jgi:hypothetical protein
VADFFVEGERGRIGERIGNLGNLRSLGRLGKTLNSLISLISLKKRAEKLLLF